MKIPQGVILIWPGTNSSIPSGWTRETSLDGKFPKAWGTQNPNETGGAETHYHQANDPGHSLINHTHTYTTGQFCSTSQFPTGNWTPNYPNFNMNLCHTHTGTTGDANGGGLQSTTFNTGTASNYPPYKKVIFIKAGNSSLLSDGIACLWGKNYIPNNWQSLSSYDNKFIVGANNNEDAGGEGGSLTHSHDITHSQTIIAHTHQDSYTNNWPGVSGGHVKGRNETWMNTCYVHNHLAHYGNDSTAGQSSQYTGTYNTTEQIEPYYIKLALIQKQTGGLKEKGIIGLWLGNTTNIPKGWVLCDGNNGTLDLRDKFIKIANSLSEIGQTGGSNIHTHANYLHTHSGINHTHNLWTEYAETGTNQTIDSGQNTTPRLHTHTGTTDSAIMTFSNSNITFASSDNQPPYRTVAYIQFQKEAGGGAFLLNFLT